MIRNLFILSLLSFFIACSSDKTEKITNTTFSKEVYDAYFNKLNPAPQVFTFKANENKNIVAEKGTKLYIEANSFIDKNGNLIKDDIQLEIQEFYSFSDMIRGQLTTMSNGKPLKTAGMLHIKATTVGTQEECFVKQDKPIQLAMPTDDYDRKMLLFEGIRSQDSVMNWNVVGTLVKSVYYPWEVNTMASYKENKAIPYNKLGDYKVGKFKTPHDSLLFSLEIDTNGRVSVLHYLTNSDSLKNNKIYKLWMQEAASFPLFEVAKLNNQNVKVYFPFCIKIDTVNKGVDFKFDYNENDFQYSNVDLALGVIDTIAIEDTVQNVFLSEIIGYANSCKNYTILENYREHLFSVLKLRWINCDAFINEPLPNSIEFIIKDMPKNLYIQSYMIFKEQSGVYSFYEEDNNKIKYRNLPNTNAKVIFFGIDMEKDIIYAATSEFKQQYNNRIIPVSLQATDKAAFDSLLNTFN